MKQIVVIFLCMLCVSGYAQKSDRLYEKYADKKGVSVIYISGAMINMASGMAGFDFNEMKNSKIESLQLLTCEVPSMIKEIEKDVEELIAKTSEKLMQIRDEEDKVSFYSTKKGERIMEIVMFAQDNKECTLIVIKGNFTANDIKKVMK